MAHVSHIFAADDWGFSPAINEGILHLADRGWLHSVSCAANAPYLEHAVDRLRAFPAVRVSLHLCYTYGRPLTDAPSLTDARGGFYAHRRFMKFGLLGRLNAQELVEEFRAQLARVRGLGLKVEDLDGHHHVHLLPFVARALQPVLADNGIRRLRALGDTEHLPSLAQTLFFRAFVWQRRTPMESCNYLRPANLRSRAHLLRKIERSGKRPLLVHPALYNDFAETGMADSLRSARVEELQRMVALLNE